MRSQLFQSIRARVGREESFAAITVTAGPSAAGECALVDAHGEVEGDIAVAGWQEAVLGHALQMLTENRSDAIDVEVDGSRYTFFVDAHVPPPRLIIVGAVQTAQSLTRLAKELGYRVIVTDARATFATEERFPEADRVIKGWPQDVLPELRMDDATYIVLLSHDPKFDEPTLHHVLPLPVRYIGAIGSRRTQEQRRQKLIAQGFDAETVAKIHGPVGLDLGGKSAEEVALAILAEMTAVRNGRSGGMITDRSAPADTPARADA